MLSAEDYRNRTLSAEANAAVAPTPELRLEWEAVAEAWKSLASVAGFPDEVELQILFDRSLEIPSFPPEADTD